MTPPPKKQIFKNKEEFKYVNFNEICGNLIKKSKNL